MYLDRNGIAFRQEEKRLLDNDKITVYRPWNRLYPNMQWWKIWEVVKTRVIEVPWNRIKWIYPIFSPEAWLVKITNIQLIKNSDIKDPEIIEHVKSIYTHIQDFSLLTKVDMEKLDKSHLIDNSEEIRKLYAEGIITPASLPKNNVKDIDELLWAGQFSLAFTAHDYAAITPQMWNFIAKEYDLDIKTSMVVAKAENLARIFDVLSLDKRFLWWWLGVWFKIPGWELLHSDKKKYFVDPIADDMQTTNFVAHFGDEIHGYNSDAAGYCESLTDQFKEIWEDITDKTIVMLGSWWTARWIALELVHREIKKIIIINRTLAKAQAIADGLNLIKADVAIAADEQSIFSLKEHIDAIINLTTKWADWEFEDFSWLTSSSWTIEDNLTTSKQLLTKFAAENPKLIVSDINLTKTWTTPLIEIAKEVWLPTLGWMPMVVYQWVDAIWTVFGDQIIQKWWSKEEVKQKLIGKFLKKEEEKK